jgi:hypothetical protein
MTRRTLLVAMLGIIIADKDRRFFDLMGTPCVMSPEEVAGAE